MKKIRFLMGLLLILAVIFVVSEAQAQTETPWVLRLTRNFGYGSGSDIQGNMTLSLTGDLSSIVKVVYFMDDQPMAELTRSRSNNPSPPMIINQACTK